MECEMCGRKIGTRRHDVGGTVMNLGACCARYGTPLDPVPGAAPAGKPSVQHGLERRAARGTTRDVLKEGEGFDLAEDYGSRIRQARERAGWTREQLGAKVAARVPELTRIEAGQLRPSDKVAKAIERELKVTLFEAVPAGTPAPAAPKGGGRSGLTIGDLLRDAMEKKE